MRSQRFDQNPGAPNREQQLATARSLDESSTVLINFAVNSVKKHPLVFSSYLAGLLLCLFSSGVALTIQQQNEFQSDLQAINYRDLDDRQREYQADLQRYSASKGWLSCDALCQDRKFAMERSKAAYDRLQWEVDDQLSAAKAKLGLLSSVGVDETRELFWTRFSQGENSAASDSALRTHVLMCCMNVLFCTGKKFAQKQTKWDALFIGETIEIFLCHSDAAVLFFLESCIPFSL